MLVNFEGKGKCMPDDIASGKRTAEYFSHFLVRKMNQALVPGLHRLSVCFHIALEEWGSARWVLTIEDGQLTRIVSGNSKSECGFTLPEIVFNEIIAGRLAPQKAFFQRQVHIDGRLDLGLRLSTVLADFFRQHPFEVTQE